MGFQSLDEILEKWLRKKGLNAAFSQQKALKNLNQYFQDQFNGEVKIVNFKNSQLKIKCEKSVIASKIKTEEKKIKDEIKKNFGLEIKKIFYQL
ncbi:MAG TPA: DciA family protein [Candidatus Paceibacterota bacterium]|nr:DciA family protein [Candidatus Paceibacterota bacterium]